MQIQKKICKKQKATNKCFYVINLTYNLAYISMYEVQVNMMMDTTPDNSIIWI